MNLPALAAVLLAFSLFGKGNQEIPPLTVRLHVEGKEHESPSFATQIELANPQRKVFIRKVPLVSEKDIAAILPFTAADGSLGCILRMDRSGAERVEQHTASARDSVVVALINGRVASASRVDRKIEDGIVTIHSGFLPEEILVLQAKHPTMGKEKEFESQKKQALSSLAKIARQAKEAARAKPQPKAEAPSR